MSSSPPQPADPTFRTFTASQGSQYAAHRLDYHPRLYCILLEHHAATGGHFSSLLDAGCGPGLAARALAPRFDRALGIDPSDGMVRTARALGGATASGAAVRFAVSNAESLGTDLAEDPVREGSVDLLVAATAAHWFDMPKFWATAAQVVRPGGTVAVWCSGGTVVSPGVPNREKVQAAVDRLEERVDAYLVEGNRIARSCYADLGLPWTVEPVAGGFEQATFVRQEWGTGEGSEPAEEFYQGPGELSLDAMEKVVGTTSPVVRWREAHPEDVGTERDVVRMMRREIEAALREGGVEPGKEVVKGGSKAALLMVKRKAE